MRRRSHVSERATRRRAIRKRHRNEVSFAIEKALKALPETADDIAAFLLKEGIKGLRVHPTQDPIARYIQSRTGIIKGVGADKIIINKYIEDDVLLPDGVREFTRRFDQYKYMDLLEIGGIMNRRGTIAQRTVELINEAKAACGDNPKEVVSYLANKLATLEYDNPPANGMKKPYHPGEILKDVIKNGLKITIEEAAKRSSLPGKTLSNLIAGEMNISPEIAVKLEQDGFGRPAEAWLRMQRRYNQA